MFTHFNCVNHTVMMQPAAPATYWQSVGLTLLYPYSEKQK